MLVFLSHAIGYKDSDLRDSFCLTQIANHKMNEMQSIGSGRVITNKDGRKIVWHDDGTYGLAIFVGFDSYSEKDVAVLTNSQEIADKIGMDILEFDMEELMNSEKN